MKGRAQISLPSDRSFGLTFAVVCTLAGGLMLWKGNDRAIVAFSLAAIFLLAAVVYPRVLHPLNIAWMTLGHLLNKVVSPIVMGVIFFGLVTPVAAIMRLRGRDVLRRRFEPTGRSYWIERNPPGPDGSTFPQQF
jgi:Saxitoxin biosynthesis operon protein SxtJ